MDERESMKKAAERAVSAMAAARMAEPLSFTGIDERPKNVVNPELMIAAGRTQADLSTLALELLLKVVAERRSAVPRPQHLILSQVKDNPDELIATPTVAAAENTVPVTWSQDGRKATINLRRFFLLRPLPLPQRTRAHIPITTDNIEDLGPSLILQLGRIYLTPMTEGRTRTARVKATVGGYSSK